MRAAGLALAAATLLVASRAAEPAESTAPAFPAGAVRGYRVPSAHEHRDRQVWVYTPPGFAADRDTSLAFLLAFDGAEYQDAIPLPRILDSLLAARAIPPTIAVLVDDSTRGARLNDLGNRAWFVDFLANELVPWARRRWPLSRDPRRALVTGSSAGGLAAAFVALRRPDLFGNVLSQSAALWRGPEASNDPPYSWLVTQARHWPRVAVRFWLEVGSTETHGALGGAAPSILAANRAFRDALRAKGYDVTYTEVEGGVHGAETWAPRLPVGLAALARRTPQH